MNPFSNHCNMRACAHMGSFTYGDACRKMGDLVFHLGNGTCVAYVALDGDEVCGFVWARPDIQETGLPSESYDIIVCNHVLEHVRDFRAALGEVRRLLCLGGMLVCSFPMDPNVELLDEGPGTSAEERLRRFGLTIA